jgi:hypothetical protein
MGCGGFLKWWIYISIVLILVIGIITEIFFIVMASGKFSDATESKGALIATGTIFLLITLVIAILGFCGICKKSTCFLVIYSIIAIALFVGFWVIFAYMKKGKKEIHKDVDKVCDDQDTSGFIQDLKEVYDKSLDTYFCVPACQCKTVQSKFPGYTMSINTGGVSAISKCATNPVKNTKKLILTFLSWLEEEEDCSGLCKAEKYYYFSDVDRGIPPKACKEPLLDYIDSKLDINQHRMV